jgi:NAD(P)H-nitrite reductase large subunit
MITAEFDAKNERYVKLLIKDDIITAAVVFGDPDLPVKIKNAITRKTKLPIIRDGMKIKDIIENL